MGKSLTRKILEPRILKGSWEPGTEIGIRIDQTLTQDATGTMAYLQFETMGIPKVQTELSVSYIDHNTLQVGFENADDHRYLASVARKYGLYLSRAGNGICHQVHLERFGKPGRTLLGSDSHTPTGGGIGMIAIGAGGLDVAMAMGGGPFYMSCPKVIQVKLKGALQPWVSAKDVALKMLELFGTKGNVGCIMEYAGEGLKTLSVPERATIANMGAEMGVTTSIFPSDETTLAFLKSQGREEAYAELAADADAEYFKTVEIDLSELEPLAALPHSPGNIARVRDIAGTPVQQVCLGSCTNSSYRDLATAAKVLEDKVSHPDVSFVVTPGSKQVVRNITKDGYYDMLVAAGGRFVEPCCGFCIGNGQSPNSGGVSLRTSNRNFEARSGTQDAQVFLVSPETAAAAVITGRITDPRDLGMAYPQVEAPATFLVDDRMIIRPEETPDPAAVEIQRGPNIGEPLKSEPYPADLVGLASIKLGDKITTDHIAPAGSRMKFRSNIKAYAEFVFENVDADFSRRASASRDAGVHNIIVAGASYGQGSSREHAAICPAFLGVKAVLAQSFERIHAANLVNFGILPLIFKDEADLAKVDASDRLEIPGIRKAIAEGTAIIVQNRTKGTSFEVKVELSERQRAIVLAGGSLAHAKESK
ncbi:aconitate hydratase [Holophaga foetida]|uniref:aconitate hydratase n=1 Tax=Holophaga foetida TaxID=35839 RepID=UPI0002472169|nr:aconitate hydratase [Holophaga foetida]